jgi:predicted DNA-binding transcriptional regulator AlpA
MPSSEPLAPALKRAPKPMPPAEYLDTKQAAAYLGLSHQFLEIARHRRDGSGPHYLKLPRAVRYRRDDLDAWMEQHRQGHEPPAKTTRRTTKAA